MEKLLRLDIFRCTSLESVKKRHHHTAAAAAAATTTTATAATTEKSDPSRFLDTDPATSVTDLDDQLQCLLQEKELLQAEYSKIPVSGSNAICRRRREDLEARLDEVDSKMRKIRLKIRRRQNKGGV
ncbi:hypothetical protein BCR42DRAFT_20302 [Absidia repens]|uniref:Enkurin domain-containing protein n=1 Tax=Absidia repens TaxID=90262 RepID=A0A1X2J2U3_9FUNG|nr:hypothetical protein BCR42DRAFT_20302 [Absidia repens]